MKEAGICMRALYLKLALMSHSQWECFDAASRTWMECPVGLSGNRKVSLKDGSLSCRHTLVFFLMILF